MSESLPNPSSLKSDMIRAMSELVGVTNPVVTEDVKKGAAMVEAIPEDMMSTVISQLMDQTRFEDVESYITNYVNIPTDDKRKIVDILRNIYLLKDSVRTTPQ